MTAEIIQFVPKANPKREDFADPWSQVTSWRFDAATNTWHGDAPVGWPWSEDKA